MAFLLAQNSIISKSKGSAFFSKLSYQNILLKSAKRKRKNAVFDLRKNIVEKDFEPNLTY